MITLRPHHGLCIRHFVGNGYSEAFIENMTDLISRLKEDTPIRLVMTRDNICCACPNWRGERCVSQEAVMRYDKAVLDTLGYPTDGCSLTYGEFQNQIEENIVQEGRFASICGDCQWSELCHL